MKVHIQELRCVCYTRRILFQTTLIQVDHYKVSSLFTEKCMVIIITEFFDDEHLLLLYILYIFSP